MVGSGGAGLWAAIRATEAGGKTLLVDKGLVGKSGNTVMASGLSVVGPWHLPGDGPEVLLQDTLAGGQFLNNRELVRLLIEEAPKRVAQLEEWGLTFDREEDGRYFLLQSGGPSLPPRSHAQRSGGLSHRQDLAPKSPSDRGQVAGGYHRDRPSYQRGAGRRSHSYRLPLGRAPSPLSAHLL